MRTFQLHGSTFTSYISPSTGSEQLCAWQLDIPAGQVGTAHRVTHEEVLLALSGELVVTIDEARHSPGVGEPVFVPRDAMMRVDAGPAGASAWVVAAAGLTAVTADGENIAPPWAR